MKKSVFSAKKMLAILLSIVTVFSCFSLAFAADHIHSYDEWVTVEAATCKSEGLKRKTCITCGIFIEDVIPVKKTAHVFDEDAWVTAKEAKCNAEGELTNACTLCGETVAKSIPALAHTFDESKWEITKNVVHGRGLKSENGYKINFCTVCNEKVTETIEVEHVFDETAWKTATNATCVTKGVEINTCTLCDDVISRFTQIDPDKHTFSTHPEVVVAPTCISAGEGYNKCDGCGKVLPVVIPIDYDNLQHTFDYTDSNIVQCEYANYRCTTCNTYLQPDTEHPHVVDVDGWTILANPSCTSKGIKQGTCTLCNDTFKVNIPIDETAHTYGAWTVLIAPTCEKEGLRVRICEHNYGHKQYEVMDMVAHKYKTEWTVVDEATCIAEGSKVNHCVNCDKDITEIIPIDEDAHELTGEWVRVSAPTCKVEGSETNNCALCGEVTRAIPLHTDTYTEYDRVNANCTYEGKVKYVCTECSATKTEILPIDENAHAYLVKTPATCSAEGLEACRHDSTHTRVIPVNQQAHTYPDEWTYPTDCSQAGERTKTCLDCAGTVSEAYTPGHIEGDWTYVVGNCTNGGTMTKHCTRCGTVIEVRDVSAGEHAYKLLETVKPTCTEQGYDSVVCTYCGQQARINTVRAKGHYLMITVSGKEPTCEEDGLTDAVRCVECGYKKDTQEIIPATGHNFVLQANGTHSCTKCYKHLVDGTEDNPTTCDCVCHNQDGLAKFFFKILNIFYKLFGTNKFCDCGVQHYDDSSIFEDIFAKPDIDIGDVEIGDILGDVNIGDLLG